VSDGYIVNSPNERENTQHAAHTHTRVLANIGVPRNLKTLSSKKKKKKKTAKVKRLQSCKEAGTLKATFPEPLKPIRVGCVVCLHREANLREFYKRTTAVLGSEWYKYIYEGFWCVSGRKETALRTIIHGR